MPPYNEARLQNRDQRFSFARQPTHKKYQTGFIFKRALYLGRLAHQWLSRKNPRSVLHILTKLEMVRRQHDDGRSVFEPAEFLALAHAGIAGEHGRTTCVRIEQDIEKMQPDTGDQDGGARTQG